MEIASLSNFVTWQKSVRLAADVIKLMSRAIDRIPNLNMGRAVFYANRTVSSHLRIAALDKSSAAMSIQDALNQFGQPGKQLTFLGIPVRKVDQILNTETKVV